MTAVLIVKTQYFGSPRNRKVESHFTTTSVVIVKTQYLGSPRNRKVEYPLHADNVFYGNCQRDGDEQSFMVLLCNMIWRRYAHILCTCSIRAIGMAAQIPWSLVHNVKSLFQRARQPS